jgi:hypothetical protein
MVALIKESKLLGFEARLPGFAKTAVNQSQQGVIKSFT